MGANKKKTSTIVKELAESGEICKTIGHKWHEYSPTGSQKLRHCHICRKYERKEWQEFDYEAEQIILEKQRKMFDVTPSRMDEPSDMRP